MYLLDKYYYFSLMLFSLTKTSHVYDKMNRKFTPKSNFLLKIVRYLELRGTPGQREHPPLGRSSY